MKRRYSLTAEIADLRVSAILRSVTLRARRVEADILHDKFPHGHTGDPEQNTCAQHGDDA